MAVSFTTKKAAAPAKPAAPSAPAAKTGAKPSPKPSPGGLSFVKRGSAAQETLAQEELKAEQRAKQKFFRFWVPKDAEAKITFLDGDLDGDNLLDIPFYHEHQVNMNGSWDNHFICTQDQEPCPICEGGSSPQYVGVFTVIDHSEYKSKKDGQIKKDNVKLLVAKRDTIKLLQKYAQKRGGLRGCSFDVSRTGDKSPSVGSAFDFIEKLTEQQLQAKYKDKHQPINYDEHLAAAYLPAKELRKLGFGSTGPAIGSEAADSDQYDV